MQQEVGVETHAVRELLYVQDVDTHARINDNLLLVSLQVENDETVAILLLNGAEHLVFVDDRAISHALVQEVRLHHEIEVSFLSEDAGEKAAISRHKELLRLTVGSEWDHFSSPNRVDLAKGFLNDLDRVSLKGDDRHIPFDVAAHKIRVVDAKRDVCVDLRYAEVQ